MKRITIDWSKVDKSQMPEWTYKPASARLRRPFWDELVRIWETEKHSPERIIDEIDNHRVKNYGPAFNVEIGALTPYFIKLVCGVDIGDVVPNFPRPNTTYEELFDALWRLAFAKCRPDLVVFTNP